MLVRLAVAFGLLVVALRLAAAQDARPVERGAYLMNGIVACGNCHAQRDKEGRVLADEGLSGGFVFDEEPFKAYAPNITPDPDTGIGKWTEAQLIRAIREGIRPDGSLIGPPMPIEFYRDMSDDDAKALVAWLKAQAAVKNVVPKSEYRIKLPPAWGPPIKEKVTAPPRSDKARYGAYLAGPLGHCMDCHTPWTQTGPDMRLAGAGGNPFKGPWGISVSANLTPAPSGLMGWSDAEIARAIREGVGRNGSRLKPPMAYEWYRNIDDEDMAALISYLRSLKPLPLGGKPAEKKWSESGARAATASRTTGPRQVPVAHRRRVVARSRQRLAPACANARRITPVLLSVSLRNRLWSESRPWHSASVATWPRQRKRRRRDD